MNEENPESPSEASAQGTRRVLVDEDLDPRLAGSLADSFRGAFTCSSVRDQNWLHLKNGVLLATMIEAGFQVLVTADRSLQFQQPLEKLGIAVVVVRDPRTAVSRVSSIAEAVLRSEPGRAMEVPVAT